MRGEGKGTGGGRAGGGAEDRGLLTQSGKWAAAAERGGPVRAALGHVGAAIQGGSPGRGCPVQRPNPRLAFPSPRSLLRTHAPVPRRTSEGEL